MNYRVKVKLAHPENADLAYLCGTILKDGRDDMSQDKTTNLLSFADGQVDRSPCGSGATARLAVQYHKGLIKPGGEGLVKSCGCGFKLVGHSYKLM